MPDPPAALKAGLTIHMQYYFLMQLYLYNWIFSKKYICCKPFVTQIHFITFRDSGGVNRADH